MRFKLHWVEIVVTINVLDDGDGVISDYNRIFHLSNVISQQEVTLLGLHVVLKLGTIVTIVGE